MIAEVAMSILMMYTLTAVFTILFTWSSASAQNRFALLIGNQTYASAVGALKNPHQDIALIEQALRHVGFSVASKQDLSRVEILQSVEAFAKLLGNAGDAVGFFYYSGHGVA
ncbi:MAG TPA: caspase family protein, partial [Candidatus Tectomicrobia bacterium]